MLNRICLAWLAALALATLGSSPGRAAAQGSGPVLVAGSEGCASDAYPAIMCVVAANSSFGTALSGVGPLSFRVQLAGGVSQMPSRVTPFLAGEVANYLLVVDVGMLERGVSANTLRDRAREVLESIDGKDRVALMLLNGAIDVGTTELSAAHEIDFLAGHNRNVLINMVNQVSPRAGSPVYDGICRALLRSSRDTGRGPRAVLLLSDGRDTASRVCTQDDVVQRAQQGRVPVFTFDLVASGNDALLRRLALQTDAMYFDLKAAPSMRMVFQSVISALKTRYRLDVQGELEPDNAVHPLVISLEHASGNTAQSSFFVAAYPLMPSLVLQFEAAGELVDGQALKFGNDLIVRPSIRARMLERVDYRVGDWTASLRNPPYAVRIPADVLSASVNPQLEVRVVGGDETRERTTIALRPLNVLPAPPIVLEKEQCSIVRLDAACFSQNMPWWLLFVSLLALGFGIVSALAMMFQRRRLASTPISRGLPTWFGGNGHDGAPAGEANVRDTADEQRLLTEFADESDIAAEHPVAPPVTMLDTGEAPPQPVAQLTIISTGRVVPLYAGTRMSVGKAWAGSSVDLQLDSDRVSKKHAEFIVEFGRIMLRDISANGTRVNSMRIPASSDVVLHNSVRISFADVEADLIHL